MKLDKNIKPNETLCIEPNENEKPDETSLKKVWKERELILGVLNFLIAGVIVMVLLIQGNKLVAHQNKIAEIEFSPVINIIKTLKYNEETKLYETIEIHVYNQNFPISEYGGKAQCVLRFTTRPTEYSINTKDYLLDGVFFANMYSQDTTGLLIKSYGPKNYLRLHDYIKDCQENCAEISHVDILYFYRFEYKDVFGERHEKYYNLSGTISKELNYKDGKALFDQNEKLERLDYWEVRYPTF